MLFAGGSVKPKGECIVHAYNTSIVSYIIQYLHIVFDNAVIVSDDVIVDAEFFEVYYNNISLYSILYINNLQMFEKL